MTYFLKNLNTNFTLVKLKRKWYRAWQNNIIKLETPRISGKTQERIRNRNNILGMKTKLEGKKRSKKKIANNALRELER